MNVMVIDVSDVNRLIAQ